MILLPKRKDHRYNANLDLLDEIVPGVENLRTRGVWYPDNFVTAATNSASLFALGTYIITSFFPENPELTQQQLEDAEDIAYFAISAIGTLVSLTAGIVIDETRRRQIKDVIKKLRFIDEYVELSRSE